MTSKLLCIGGARPNFMKLAPLVRAIDGHSAFEPVLVHTGQHYDEMMSGRFFRELGMGSPRHNLAVGSGSHAQQTAEIMKRFEPVLLEEEPAAIIVVGDVNSTVACALVAAKLSVPVVHVEAGLRSFDRTMPEEINRVVTDAISDILLVTEESGRRNLLNEGVPSEKIHLIGNLMIDTLHANLERAKSSRILDELEVSEGDRYGVVTLHRPSNVDETAQFEEMIRALAEISREVPLIFPVHPRTKARLEETALPEGAAVRLIEPLGYLDFLCLMEKSSVVFTDSGGIQEETTALGIQCLTLRNNTERPITLEQGTNSLAGTSHASILKTWAEVKDRAPAGVVPPFWDGKAAERAVAVLQDSLGHARASRRQLLGR